MSVVTAINTDALLTTERSDVAALSASRSGLLSAQEDCKPARSNVFADGSFWTAVLTIANAALGAGLLSIPYAIASAGLASGGAALLVLIIACCASLCIIMARMAVAQAADPSVTSFGALVAWGCGPLAAWFVELLVLTNSFGACIGYVVVLGDVITPLVYAPLQQLAPKLSAHNARIAVCCVAAVFCLLLSLLRRISALRYTAAVAVFACFYTAGMLIIKAALSPCTEGHCFDETSPPRNGWCTREQALNATLSGSGACNAEAPQAGVSLWPVDAAAFFRALPIFMSALQCHIQVAFIFAEAPSRLRTRWPRLAIGGTSMALLLLFYAAVGAAGFLRFGAQTQGDCLENFSGADAVANVARVAVGITALSAFPMQHFPARAALHHVWSALGCTRGGRISTLFLLAEGVLWVCVTGGLALLVGSDLSFVFEMLGSIVVGAVVLLVPAALLLRAGQAKALAIAFIFIGGFITVSGTYTSIMAKIGGH